jgi:DNA-binding NarL/FixJ family response regulator
LLAERVVDAVIIDGAAELDSSIGREWLVELLDTLPLIVLSGAPDTWTFNQFIRAERGAILSRDASTEQLVHAVRAACAGLLVFDSSSTPRTNTSDEVLTELTPREVQVLQLLAEGLANRDIAERLGISEHTIKFHIASILGKLQASSRTEAVTRGLRSGLIEL